MLSVEGDFFHFIKLKISNEYIYTGFSLIFMAFKNWQVYSREILEKKKLG